MEEDRKNALDENNVDLDEDIDNSVYKVNGGQYTLMFFLSFFIVAISSVQISKRFFKETKLSIFYFD